MLSKPEFPLSSVNNKGYETMEILNQTKFITDLASTQFSLQHNDNGQNNKMYFYTSNDNIILRQGDLGRSRLPSGGGRQNQGDTAKKNTDFLHLFPPLWSLVPGYNHHLTRRE